MKLRVNLTSYHILNVYRENLCKMQINLFYTET